MESRSGAGASPDTLARPVVEGYLQAARRVALAGAEGQSSHDARAVADDALQALLRASGMTIGAVYLLDDDGRCARCLAFRGFAPGFSDRFGELPAESGALVARAIRTYQPQYTGRTEAEPLARPLFDELGADTFIIAPFRAGAAVGSIAVAGQRDEPPREAEVTLLQIAAEGAGQAIAAARARDEDARSRSRARFLTEVCRACSVSLDLSQMLDTVVRLAHPVIGDWCIIYLRDGDTMSMRAAYHPDFERLEAIRALFSAQPVRVGEGIAGTVVLTGEPRIFRTFDEAALHTLASRASDVYLEGLRLVKSWVCLPLMARGRGLGALVFATEHRQVTDDDLEIAGAFAEVAAAALDNARLYEAERSLRIDAESAQAQLAVVDRQKDEFLSIAAHELRTPLTSAQGFAQVLLRRARVSEEPDQRLTDGLAIMEGQLRRIAALLNELLDLSRVQIDVLPLHTTPVSLGELVVAVCDQLRALPGGDRIDVSTPSTPLIGMVDRDRIEQIVVNLVENALKYSPEGGRVDVTLTREGGDAVLRVRDRGIGVPAESLPFLFQRFYRIADEAHAQISGLGIGLYVCRKIAERHGGSIGVEPSDGPGSVFVLRLPLPASPGPTA